MEQARINYFTIPNLITLISLSCGCAAVVAALVHGDLRCAFWWIVAAGIFDFTDGFAARLLRQSSALGVQLDSLSDMVSFGLAPSAILFTVYRSVESGACPEWLAYICFLIALFSALRLAKFNIDTQQKSDFIGLPTPACALIVASSGYLYAVGELDIAAWWVIAAAIILSLLLISPVRMFSLKFKDFSLKNNLLRYVIIAAGIISISIAGIAGVLFTMVLYVLLSSLRNLFCHMA